MCIRDRDLGGVPAEDRWRKSCADRLAVDPPGTAGDAHLAQLLMLNPQLQRAALDVLVGEDLIEVPDGPGWDPGHLQSLEEVRTGELTEYCREVVGELCAMFQPQRVGLVSVSY